MLHVLVQREMWGTTVTSEVKGVTLDGGDWSWEPMKLPICCLLVIYLSLFRYNLSLSGFYLFWFVWSEPKREGRVEGNNKFKNPFFFFEKKLQRQPQWSRRMNDTSWKWKMLIMSPYYILRGRGLFFFFGRKRRRLLENETKTMYYTSTNTVLFTRWRKTMRYFSFERLKPVIKFWIMFRWPKYTSPQTKKRFNLVFIFIFKWHGGTCVC